MKRLCLALACVASAVLAACGGGSAAPATTSVVVAPTPAANTMPIVVDQGPADLVQAGLPVVNTPFVSVTLCVPGSATVCQTIDHVALDTGSSGLRVMASAFDPGVVLPVASDPASNLALRECAQFADGFAWGSVVAADVQLGGATVASLPVHLIGDADSGTAPDSCVSGPDESTVFSFGANGVLGVGNFVQDCGDACATGAIPGTYYACDAGGGVACTSVTVATGQQVSNPVALLAGDNNGLVMTLASAPVQGEASATGTMTFGIGTETNNTFVAARFYTLDDAGTLVTIFDGLAQSGSFIDSGSNALYFSDAALTTCSDASVFYCPSQTQPMSAVIQGLNGISASVDFVVSNADQLLSTADAVMPGLAGPDVTPASGASAAFDWGLPFFFGRNVYVLFEGRVASGSTGPAVGF